MWRPDDYEMAGYELVKVANEDGETFGYIISEAEQASIDEEMSKYYIPNEGVDIEPFYGASNV